MNWLERIIEWLNGPSDPLTIIIFYLVMCFIMIGYARLNLPDWSISE